MVPWHRVITLVVCMHKLLCWIVIFAPIVSWAESERVGIAHFSQGDLSGWQSKVFAGQTVYAFEREADGMVLRADSSASASGLYRAVSIDLNKTPILNWDWKVANILMGNDERTKTGDDYPARIYVIFSGGVMFWRTRAINYVWSNKQPVDSNWLNAYTNNARMIAIQSGSDHVGHWVHESRDVLADYRRLFGEEPSVIDAVAIMTDTDNTGASATAWYGDIWFTAQ
ncbi:Protein of unknown function [Nitrosomonas aestuarii]|uniref:DUF3047 domain-containing protein n=2 Tax=Nitrosomonas aestuarii TaxID=52441 RepID=A0A1I4EYI6_9PROT|nr:Protein of unknown function [Nitrosomonas aestuarii]